jgi:hypothetical protein
MHDDASLPHEACLEHTSEARSTGVYGASAGAVPTTLNALWSEGLATFQRPDYVGTLIAQDLSTRYTLPELAHLNGTELRATVVTALDKLSAAP